MPTTKTSPRLSPVSRGLLALGLGAALLLGTGATSALWQVQQDIPGTTFQTGRMALNDASFTWTAQHLDYLNRPIGPSHAVSPGQKLYLATKLTGTATIAPELVGDNLTATIRLTNGQVIDTTGPLLGAKVRLLVNDYPVSYFRDVERAADQPVKLQVEITLPYYAIGSIGEHVGIEDVTVTLNQDPPQPLNP